MKLVRKNQCFNISKSCNQLFNHIRSQKVQQPKRLIDFHHGLINFSGISTRLELFYALTLENFVHYTFIFAFLL